MQCTILFHSSSQLIQQKSWDWIGLRTKSLPYVHRGIHLPLTIPPTHSNSDTNNSIWNSHLGGTSTNPTFGHERASDDDDDDDDDVDDDAECWARHRSVDGLAAKWNAVIAAMLRVATFFVEPPLRRGGSWRFDKINILGLLLYQGIISTPMKLAELGMIPSNAFLQSVRETYLSQLIPFGNRLWGMTPGLWGAQTFGRTTARKSRENVSDLRLFLFHNKEKVFTNCSSLRSGLYCVFVFSWFRIEKSRGCYFLCTNEEMHLLGEEGICCTCQFTKQVI